MVEADLETSGATTAFNGVKYHPRTIDDEALGARPLQQGFAYLDQSWHFP
jgi:hypothetical protein